MTQNKNKQSGNSFVIWVGLGIALGAAYGAFSGNISLGVGIGVVLVWSSGRFPALLKSRK